MKHLLLLLTCLSFTAIAEPLRSAENQARDQYRHPQATLDFFEVKPHHKVVEIWPGTGWYTEILAPMLAEQGKLIAAHFPSDSPVAFYTKYRAAFDKRVAETPEFSRIEVTSFAPPTMVKVADKDSIDRVLTFRNVHNWMRNQGEQAAFNSFYRVLKPGGILGVVEHRAPANFSLEKMIDTGYVSEEYVIKLATKAGFKLVGKSEINANSKDTKNYPKGVWTLPPSLRMGDTDKAKYLKIGESDRMTLKFMK